MQQLVTNPSHAARGFFDGKASIRDRVEIVAGRDISATVTRRIGDYNIPCALSFGTTWPGPDQKGAVSRMSTHTSGIDADKRLEIARTLFKALIAQDADRVITLCDGDGRVVARHEPWPEQRAGNAS